MMIGTRVKRFHSRRFFFVNDLSNLYDCACLQLSMCAACDVVHEYRFSHPFRADIGLCDACSKWIAVLVPLSLHTPISSALTLSLPFFCSQSVSRLKHHFHQFFLFQPVAFHYFPTSRSNEIAILATRCKSGVGRNEAATPTTMTEKECRMCTFAKQ